MDCVKIKSHTWETFEVYPEVLTDYWKEQFKILEKITALKTTKSKARMNIDEDLFGAYAGTIYFEWYIFDVKIEIEEYDGEINKVLMKLTCEDLYVANEEDLYITLDYSFDDLKSVYKELTNPDLIDFAINIENMAMGYN